MPKFRCPTPAAALFAVGCFALSSACAADQRVYDLPRERGYAPLRPVADCLDPDRARSWHRLSGDRLVVDAGRKAYLLTLAHGCPRLGLGAGIGFVSRNPGGRICGDIGDAVVPSGPVTSLPRQCSVARVSVLSEAAAERLIVDAVD